MKSVYVINGFLESGKTEFITYTLAQPYFQIKGKTLLILCEEGEVEYEEELLAKSKTVLELIEEEEEFTASRLLELEKKHKPDRIIIEYNGMWNFKEMKLPWHWKIDQQITTIDGSTFPMYFTNMRSLLAEMVRNSEMIIFNRCDGIEDLSSYKRNIKAINTKLARLDACMKSGKALFNYGFDEFDIEFVPNRNKNRNEVCFECGKDDAIRARKLFPDRFMKIMSIRGGKYLVSLHY